MRKTKAEKDHEFYSEQRREWSIFQTSLSEAKTYGEALALVHQAPGQGAAGRKYYSNLGFFLGGFMVPHGATESERGMYVGLIQRFLAAGEVDQASADKIIAALKKW